VRKIKTSIHNLTDILNDFLSESRLEEGKVENRPQEIDLEVFVPEIISEIQPLLGNQQTLAYAQRGESIVSLDPNLLKNILFNLLSNAIKFSPEGGEIRLDTIREPFAVVLTVSDRGIGISEADQQYLFERFFRGHNATHIQGTGLGLSILAHYERADHGAAQRRRVFGYLSLLKEEAYTDATIVLEDAEVYILSKADFFALIDRNADVTRRFIGILSDNLREMEQELVRLAYNSVRKRVAEALVRLSDKYKKEDRQPFSMQLFREDLAQLVGTSTETVIRMLSDLKEEQYISISGSTITVLAYDKLVAMKN
jgi:CRP-like cAMP-binding protein